jgi:signal transduction histidine kinase
MTYEFLQGGGEMGELARIFDWDTSPLGRPDGWPASLRTTLGIVLHSAFPMFLFWSDDLICFYNDPFRPSLGTDGKHPALGKKGKEVWPEIWDFIGPLIRQVMTTGKPVWFEDQLVPFYRNGRIEDIYWTFSYSPAYGDDGRISGVVVTCTETTRSVQMLKSLEESEERAQTMEKNLRNTILKAPVAICIFRGPEYVVEIANDRMLELWGVVADKVMHKPIFEGLPEVRNQGFEELVHSVYHTGQAISIQEHPIVLPRNGKLSNEYVSFLYEPEIGATGDIIGILAVAIIVTEQVLARHQIEDLVAERTRELAEANRNLKRSNAELSQFAHIASHDLQEPIRKITTYTQLLEKRLGTVDTVAAQSYLDKIGNAGSRMGLLVRDILAFSELSESGPTLEMVDLGQIASEILEEFDLLIEEKQARISVGSLPILSAIPLQMQQLFGNLISNALKYAKTDVPPMIDITADREGERWHIRFADNGIGFAPEHAQQIFSIFQRLHRKSEYSGTGIGLAICQKIAQNHRGDIYATGKPGAGATFHVLLPVAPLHTA